MAALVAIIAADFSTAQAQSDDETTGRIVARLLDDGRVEFGWQPTGGEQVLPRQRYFPADPGHDRWLRSSPVEVGGVEIGRINARQLSDGRIEFAFTPTDGERIEPRARYFPADARVGRWLRSTEIAISPPEDIAPGFIAISAGGSYTCAIRTSGEIECWGRNSRGQTDAPAEGNFTAVSVALIEGDFTCAVSTSREIECWGANGNWYRDDAGEWRINETGQTDALPGNFTTVSAGRFHACGLRETGDVACWGNTWDTPPEGKFISISAGFSYTCAIRESGAIECWGINTDWQGQHLGQADAPDGRFTAVSASFWHTCGLRASREIECWGDNQYGQSNAPEGSYTAVNAGERHTCAIRTSGAVECWGAGDDFYGQTDAPPGKYTAVSAGNSHTCAIRESDGGIECWGSNEDGQTDVPSN